MSILSLINQFRLDADTARRLADVLLVATASGDTGVINWVHVAMTYAVNGELRARDAANLTRLEDTYNSDFYRGPTRVGGDYIFA